MLDYHRLHLMIAFCRPRLPKQYLKRWDYLADARIQYLHLHYIFYTRFNGLQDLRVFEDVLVMRKGDLIEQIREYEEEGRSGAAMDKKKRDLQDIMFQIERNRAELPVLTEQVKYLASKRDKAASWLSEMKLNLLKEQVPPLLYFTKKLVEAEQRQEAERGE